MLIISLESTAATASAAIIRDRETLGQAQLSAGSSTHSVTLLPLLDSLLSPLALTPSDADAFAVAVGPGSFTGVRIGVSLIKGLAFGTGKPCVAVPTLEAMALPMRALGGICVPVIDARRSLVYTALFENRSAVDCGRLTPDRQIAAAELLLCLAEDYADTPRVWLCGDGIPIVFRALDALEAKAADDGGGGLSEKLAVLRAKLTPAPEAIRLPSAQSAALRALELIESGSDAVKTDASLAPVYLKATQAERERLGIFD